MKKGLKIALISFGSLLALIIIAVMVVVWLVATPARLTPIVKDVASKYITCPVNLDKVDLTIFKTFPNVGLNISNLQLIHPFPGALSDTLANVEDCTVSIDIKELLKNKNIIIQQFHLDGGSANIFVDENGTANYDIFILDTTNNDESSFSINKIDLSKVIIKNLNATYVDLSAGMEAGANDVSLLLRGNMNNDNIQADLELNTGAVSLLLHDSIPLKIMSEKITTTFKGNIDSFDDIKGNLKLALSGAALENGEALQIQPVDIKLTSPLALSISKQALALEPSEVAINEFQIKLDGLVSRDTANGAISTGIHFATNSWDIEKILALVPQSLIQPIAPYNPKGNILLSGSANGIYHEETMPLIAVDLIYENGMVTVPELPYKIEKVKAGLSAEINMNATSKVNVRELKAQIGNSTVNCSGTVNDLFNKMLCDANIKAKVVIPEWQSMLPKGINVSGIADLSVSANLPIKQVLDGKYNTIKASGGIGVSDLDFIYYDTITGNSSLALIDFQIPRESEKPFLMANISAGDLEADVTGLVSGKLEGTKLKITSSDFTDTTKLPSVTCDFEFNSIAADIDTLSVRIQHPVGTLKLSPTKRNPKQPYIDCTYSNEHLDVQMGNSLALSTGYFHIDGNARYDKKQDEVLLQWNPVLNFALEKGHFEMTDLAFPVEIPALKFDFSTKKLNIHESRVVLGNSVFQLSGEITQFNKYLRKKAPLKGELQFISDNTDVDQLMELVNGLGSNQDSLAVQEMESKEDNPFMVPMRMDISMNTLIKRASVGETTLHNLHGLLAIKDGVLVLEEMGFTSDAARMQLTAIYRSPRKNHLFAGIDFHLLDIDIAQLIQMFPEVDTLLPMLKSFAGKAEFHFAIETYLKSNYELKFSTLRGALAIAGKELVLLDNQTFSTISKKLLFSKKAKNVVDSLSVEATLYKGEIDIYPFLIAMDRYKAVIAGRHNLDMQFDYHISITDTPLPLRLGLDIKGKPEKMKFKLAKCQYPKLFVPGKQGVTDDEILKLKKIIADALKANVKEY